MSVCPRLALLLAGLALGCGERAPTPVRPGAADQSGPGGGAAPVADAAAAIADAAAPAGPDCTHDEDCVGDWSPSVPSCVPPDRCIEGHCGPPAAMTGVADATTGRLVLETPTGPRTYQVELARATFETQRGLMCRASMRPDWGMLFVMPETRVHSFWMFNTLISLDILFLDADWTVVGVSADAVPLTRSPRTVGRPSAYVLELVGGAAAEAGIGPGTRARFYGPRATP